MLKDSVGLDPDGCVVRMIDPTPAKENTGANAGINGKSKRKTAGSAGGGFVRPID